MKITADTTFAQVETAQRQRLESAVERAAAQAETARELLTKAERQGHETGFWARAVEFAEAEEARARRTFAKWQHRDRQASRRAFDFSRDLCAGTQTRLNAQRMREESDQLLKTA